MTIGFTGRLGLKCARFGRLALGSSEACAPAPLSAVEILQVWDVLRKAATWIVDTATSLWQIRRTSAEFISDRAPEFGHLATGGSSVFATEPVEIEQAWYVLRKTTSWTVEASPVLWQVSHKSVEFINETRAKDWERHGKPW